MAAGSGRAPGRERGAAAVEFALVVPLLITLLFGIISFGFMLSFRQSISQAAAEGARAAVVAPAGADRETIATDAIEDAMGVACGSAYLTCSFPPVAGCSSCLAVEVSYDYAGDPSKPELVFGFALPDTLSYTATATVS